MEWVPRVRCAAAQRTHAGDLFRPFQRREIAFKALRVRVRIPVEDASGRSSLRCVVAIRATLSHFFGFTK